MVIKPVKLLACCLATLLPTMLCATNTNQTPTVSPIFPADELPFSVNIELCDTPLPIAFHSGASAVWQGTWLFIAGRTNGLHGFDNSDNNFPSDKQNTDVIVVDITRGIYSYRSLEDPKSGLSQEQIDLLSVTSPQSYQVGKTLYISGGYSVDSSTGEFSTKDALTAIDVPGLIAWVVHPSSEERAKKHIRHLFDPIFQIAGGFMAQIDDEVTLLGLGQNFRGYYNPNSNGEYSKQVRRFKIIDDGCSLAVKKKDAEPPMAEESYRRRDLNVVPSIRYDHKKIIPYFTAFSGVFTLAGGAWTIPIIIESNGCSFTFSPDSPSSFKQGMNNYASANVSLFSKVKREMFTTIFGGISYGYFSNNTFATDGELPFINQVTTISRNADGEFSQYLMDASYPTILSTGPHRGNELLFGAGAKFILDPYVRSYRNGVINFDALPPNRPTIIGYIVGGIQSTLPNTNTREDSSASSYIFNVVLTKNIRH